MKPPRLFPRIRGGLDGSTKDKLVFSCFRAAFLSGHRSNGNVVGLYLSAYRRNHLAAYWSNLSLLRHVATRNQHRYHDRYFSDGVSNSAGAEQRRTRDSLEAQRNRGRDARRE